MVNVIVPAGATTTAGNGGNGSENNGSPGGLPSGGGGLGAGGAIFVMNGASLTVTGGTFAGNAVASGTGWSSGSAYGADLFSGANVTFDVPNTLVLTSLGGAGNTSDVNITNNYGLNLAGDPNANGGLIKTGAGTLLLTGTNYYSGITTVHSGTLAGGVLRTGVGLSETFGTLNATGAGSIIDFLGTASTLNFASLSLDGSLAIWNYAGANDFLNIASGTATGSLSQITFFSDSGSTFLGYGGFTGTQLVPVAVPEPSTVALALAGLACGGYVVWRRNKRD